MKRISKIGKVYDTGTRQNVHVCATQEEKAWLAAHDGDSKGFHAVMALAMNGGLEAVLAIRKLLQQIEATRQSAALTEQEAQP